jgi:hypothetical protein
MVPWDLSKKKSIESWKEENKKEKNEGAEKDKRKQGKVKCILR